jgi:phosphoserine phosphatase
VIEVPAGFSDEVRARLAEVAEPRVERSVAVFDFDNTCVRGDIGEIYSQWLVDELAYKVDLDVFWDQVDPRDGRDEARRLVEELRRLADDDPARASVYDAYRSEMAAIYPRLMGREGKAAAYAWAVLLHVGLTEQEMFDLSRRCVEQAWATPLGHEVMRTPGGEEYRYEVGMRRFAAIRRIMDWLRACGHEVWIVSATNWWTVSTAAKIVFGHDPRFVAGNRVEVDADGVLSARLVPPALFREGKVEVIKREIGVRPAFVFGDSETDLSMLEWAESLAVLIDHGDEIAGEAAARLNWAVQRQSDLELEGPDL